MSDEDNELLFTCPQCEATLKTRRELAGRNAQCPKCKAPLTIPQDDA